MKYSQKKYIKIIKIFSNYDGLSLGGPFGAFSIENQELLKCR